MMPEMDGYALCALLKADVRLQAIPVIFITALADAEDETRGLALGAVDYITKPFKEAIVRLRVKTHLEVKRQRDILDQLSHLDGLTGIPNRRAFDERLDREWRRAIRSQDPLAVAIMDIDHFKQYNDAYGHLAGDDCLRQVAVGLTAGPKRAGDFVARFGGEEFVCLLDAADAGGLAIMAEKLRAGIESLHIAHETSPVSPWVTISIGAAICVPTLETPVSDFLGLADTRLFEAKRLGRNRVRCQA